ncbi:hypothetical protein, partial [uncultured Pedobacter sp.]|uniref:hypothetical protein n=1 Tax=uncultured Pedobacter sp. TaxID=246139 RepID=UPI0025E29531
MGDGMVSAQLSISAEKSILSCLEPLRVGKLFHALCAMLYALRSAHKTRKPFNISAEGLLFKIWH